LRDGSRFLELFLRVFDVSRSVSLKRSRFSVYLGEKHVKQAKLLIAPSVSILLAVSLVLPLVAHHAAAVSVTNPAVLQYGPDTRWLQIKTDTISLIFPAGGKKPMFLWWHSEDASNLYVVKYKGLVEFLTFEHPYYLRANEANALRMQAMLTEKYFEPGQHRLQAETRQRLRERLMQVAYLEGLHNPYLFFGACEWNLTGPVEVTRGDVQYLSFNFTLIEVPFPNLKFAEDNVIIRCRFYSTPATETVDDLVTYTVDAGELKMDLIVRNWTWNIDVLEPLLKDLADHGIDVPVDRSGLALWVNLASIPVEMIGAAAEDITVANGGVETASTASNMYVQGLTVGIRQNKTLMEDEQPMRVQSRLRDRFKLRFEDPDATLSGFFKFVPEAIVRGDGTADVVEVDASYIAAGGHMRLFISYPYFGSNTLEHDPSLGLEVIPTLMTPELLLLLVGSASVIAVVVLAVRYKRRTVNVVGPR
jgi:hypothetical protein